MAATLTYGSTVTIVPQGVSREELALAVSRDSIGGYRRLGFLWRKYRYKMTLEPLTQAEYDAVRDLWIAARAAGAWPTFAWPEWWNADLGAGVAVEVELGPQTNAYGSVISTTLTLTEVNPR